MKQDIYITQIRMSEALHQRIMRISAETGDSINGTMLMLLALGAKQMEHVINVQVSSDSGTSTGP